MSSCACELADSELEKSMAVEVLAEAMALVALEAVTVGG